MADTKVVYRGAPWMTILQVIMIVLKVSGTVSWTWGITLLPLWIGLGSFAIVLLIAAIAIAIAVWMDR